MSSNASSTCQPGLIASRHADAESPSPTVVAGTSRSHCPSQIRPKTTSSNASSTHRPEHSTDRHPDMLHSNTTAVSLPLGDHNNEIKCNQTLLTAQEDDEITQLSRTLVRAGASIIEKAKADRLQLSNHTDPHTIHMVSAVLACHALVMSLEKEEDPSMDRMT
ncbi:hypothetical protein CSUB01_11264 [Colletotrichum sublineola]|uniref:Uncharacterized protein n=1 Tax=Colletotrichum sublineola TaxID=1173701 RepID=A0A066X7B9_COLSU|nr:hypothetical protein CSUB01_11264 [Colletotrichum sublineola]